MYGAERHRRPRGRGVGERRRQRRRHRDADRRRGAAFAQVTDRHDVSADMARRVLLAALLVLAALPAAAQAAGRCGDHPWCDTNLSADRRAELLLNALTPDERIGLLGGDEQFGVAGQGHTGTSNGVPRVGLPTIYYSDGPVGSRQGKATSMPAPIGLAATFDPQAARRHGAIVADEVKAKGNDVVFAPTVNIMRTPLAGRTFEGYGEDPFLAGAAGRRLDQGRAGRGRDRQRQALRGQQPGGRRRRGSPARRSAAPVARQPHDGRRARRRAHAARDLPARTSRPRSRRPTSAR